MDPVGLLFLLLLSGGRPPVDTWKFRVTSGEEGVQSVLSWLGRFGAVGTMHLWDGTTLIVDWQASKAKDRWVPITEWAYMVNPHVDRVSRLENGKWVRK